jgi:nucleoside-diphosphate-sugar epimerase
LLCFVFMKIKMAFIVKEETVNKNSDQARVAGRVAFVTGGSGFVGKRLIAQLVAKGWTVRALARTQQAATAIAAAGGLPVRGELNDLAALGAGMAGSDTVFHVAAMFKLWGERKDFDHVNVDGMRALVEVAVASKSVARVVAVSAAAVVMGDPVPMENIDETLPVQERSFAPYSSSKGAAERVLLSASGARPAFETIAIRPPMIWGAGMPMLDHMVETVKAGQWQWVGHGKQAMSTCHLDNLVDALLLAADHGRGGEAYFVADAETGTLKSVISGLLATKHVKAADKAVSFGMAWTLAGVMASAWRVFRLKGEPPITRQMLRLIGQPFTVRSDKARRELGYVPRISWKEGLANMARMPAGGQKQ